MNKKCNLFFHLKSPGQLLVEVVLSVGLIALLVAAVVPLVLSSTKAMRDQEKVSQASLLGKETLDTVRAIKEEDWNSIYLPLGTSSKGSVNLYHTELISDKWQLVTGEESVTLDGNNFQRSLIIENVSRTGSNGSGEIEPNYNSLRDDPSTQKITVTVGGFGGSPIVLVEFVSRWSNQLFSDTSWSTGQNPTQTNVDFASTPGALLLTSRGGGNDTYGNKFLMTATATIGALNNTTKQADMRFTAQQDGTVNNVSVYLTTASSLAGTKYNYGLQADNSGLPSGTYLSSASSFFNKTGWKTITIPSVSVTAGTVYHLVVQYASGRAPTAANYIDIRDSSPQNNIIPKIQKTDLNQNTLFYSGTVWGIQNREPIYRLGFIDGSFEGNPYDTFEARSIFGANWEGETMTIAGDKVANSLSLMVSKSTAVNPADDLHFTIEDLTTSTKLVDNLVFTNGAALTTGYSMKTYTFSSPITLTDTHQYRLYFSSPFANRINFYRIINVSNPGTAGFKDINWDGTKSLVSRSTKSGANWTETDYIDLSGYYFSLSAASTYSLSGYLVSQTFDATKKAGFNRISWTNLTLPANTSVKLQLAANNDQSTWNFSGPDGTAGTYYTINSGENISSVLSNNRYIRYKAYLATTNDKVTPVLADVTLGYSL
ncbi:TPA: hypothetical protein DD449_04595 [Candidatus Berkelbacteria bacterium]|uniref:Uncharacterized protein n=1 Tax=Berkelbacteria bacterium GW2011_GWE1_39_12 TaxID=1618337 RepID=A0A0G4B3C8_9BACT|nr:MAG: hypothetical protein UT28_C0001G0539 [Berkelbacteria bacterium GW2011_GWE1_39_12]HBO60934.1 hypothetical protein [Candidatus Berkelbacteria bacterium]